MPNANAHRKASDTTAAVDQFLAENNHPHKAAIQALRALILGVDPAIQEGIKWNAPSYRTSDYFATTNLRDKRGVGIILHLGAKVRNETLAIDDPAQLLTWLGTDRASVSFIDIDDVRLHAPAFQAILVQWISRV
jgi:hypothetical protein